MCGALVREMRRGLSSVPFAAASSSVVLVAVQAFEHFMNLDARCAMFLALYVDEMMKHGFKGQSDQDVDLALEKVRSSPSVPVHC